MLTLIILKSFKYFYLKLLILFNICCTLYIMRCPRGVMVKAMDCGIVVRKFVLRSLSGKYPWERCEPPYPASYGLNSTTTVLLGEWLWH